MRAIELKLNTNLYRVYVQGMDVAIVKTLGTDNGKIKADISDYRRSVIFEPDSTVGRCSQYDYKYFINLDEAQEYQKNLRLKHIDELRIKAEKAQQEYTNAVNEYIFTPVTNPHEN